MTARKRGCRAAGRSSRCGRQLGARRSKGATDERAHSSGESVAPPAQGDRAAPAEGIERGRAATWIDHG